MKILVLFPIDLYDNISYLKSYDKVFLVEEEIFFNRSSKSLGNLKFNILKPVYHRATMRAYYDRLKNKFKDNKINITYINLKDDWVDIVKKYKEIHFFDPVDKNLEKKIKKNFNQYEILDTPRFIAQSHDLDEYDGALKQTSFYSWMRKRFNILMKDNKPIGGKLTFDTDNRKSPYQGIEKDVKKYNEYEKDTYINEAFKYVRKNINNLIDRDMQEIKFPITNEKAKIRLRKFIKYKLDKFGDYQDVILDDDDNSFVFHSGISPMLNIGLITPLQVINEVLDNIKSIKINNIEGFIRQVLGWREFSRYIYEYHSDKYLDKNYFNQKNKLTKDWYDGNTGIRPLDMCINKAFNYGYLHHIERLMIVANCMVLHNIDPREMYKWFMEFSLDSYDWVMEYNVYCMGSYADGGHFTTKPYISTSNYIYKMSNFDRDTSWSDEWDLKFWEFMERNKNKIKKIGRLSALIKYAKKNIQLLK